MATAPIRYKLRNWRRNNDLTQSQAAAKVGVGRRAWHQWEQGATVPGPAVMIELVALTEGAIQPNDFYELPKLTTRQAA